MQLRTHGARRRPPGGGARGGTAGESVYTDYSGSLLCYIALVSHPWQHCARIVLYVWLMAALTVAEAVERVVDELGLREGSRRPKAVASAALEQLALPSIEGEGLKAQLGRVLQELDIESGWSFPERHESESSDARLCVLAIGGWDSQFQRLQRVDALEWSASDCAAPAWRPLPALLKARCASAVCVTSDGSVMVVGGIGEKSVEVRHPSAPD